MSGHAPYRAKKKFLFIVFSLAFRVDYDKIVVLFLSCKHTNQGEREMDNQYVYQDENGFKRSPPMIVSDEKIEEELLSGDTLTNILIVLKECENILRFFQNEASTLPTRKGRK